jgi:hypothetical protein
LLKDTANSGVKVGVALGWTDKPADKVYVFYFTAQHLADYAEVNKDGFNDKKAFTMTIAGLDVLTAGQYISNTFFVESENTGVSRCAAESFYYIIE